MTKTIDARGLPCPQPVLLTRNTLQEANTVMTIVDNETARHNVARMAERAGCTVQVESREDGIYVLVTKGVISQQQVEPEPAPVSQGGPLVLVVPSDHMGRGEHAELGQILTRGFFHTLGEVTPLPDTIIFFNSGVQLVVHGSPVLEDLDKLSQQGVEILACGTCLGYYGLKDAVAVGEISNMYTIAERMLGAGRTVTL